MFNELSDSLVLGTAAGGAGAVRYFRLNIENEPTVATIVAPAAKNETTPDPKLPKKGPKVESTSRKPVVGRQARKVAEWALGLGASLKVESPDGVVEVKKSTELPDQFLLTEIRFPEGTTGVTDEGMRTLAGLTELTRLEVRGSSVTDEGVKFIASASKLRLINLHACTITEKSLEVLAGLKSLEHLDVGWNRNVTDAGLAHIIKLPELRFLNLASTAVTKEGIKKLAGLHKLESVDVTGVAIDDETRNLLQQKIPGLKLGE
jgi:hypothetical protein